jgi:hypothetical protein
LVVERLAGCVFGHNPASFSATNIVMTTVPDVVLGVVGADRDEDAVRAVGDTGSVMAGGDVGEESPLAAGAVPGATPGAAARKHKGKEGTAEKTIAVMEAYAIVSGDPTTGASQCATELAARIERRFLATGGARRQMSL